MRLRDIYVRARSMPPHVFIRKAAHLGGKKLKGYSHQMKDGVIASRVSPSVYRDQVPNRLFSEPVPSDLIRSSFAQLDNYLDLLLEHRFDLLGSGWVHVGYGSRYPGLDGIRYEPSGLPQQTDVNGDWLASQVNRTNLQLSRATWRLIEGTYEPIDWHVDFKSGYRWDPSDWWLTVPYGHRPGVDVKVPWELSRMQHLPVFALGYATAKAEGKASLADRLARECRNQILDFISLNPARFGVNWRCPMDVAIRAANWSLAIDIFRANGHEFDGPFYEHFLASLLDHGRFIFTNFERAFDFRGNHYLADVAGLAFIALALPAGPENDAWLEFCFKSLIEECEYQFHSDGSNFEGSTAYHRLSAEMLIYSLCALLAAPEERKRALRNPPDLANVPSSVWKRISGMRDFTLAVSKPGYQIVQIGDCDSGRFFKMQPALREYDRSSAEKKFLDLHLPPNLSSVLVEDQLDQRHIVGLIDGLTGTRSLPESDSSAGAIDGFMGRVLGKKLAGANWPVESHAFTVAETTDENAESAFLRSFEEAPTHTKQRYEFPLPARKASSGAPIQLNSFPEFGAFVYRSESFFLSVRCGPVGQLARGGHDHNDQLSIELEIEGKPVVLDPGTFIYTPLPEQRNRYRSVQNHFAPRIPGEEGVNLGALFFMGQAPAGRAVSVTSHSFLGQVTRAGKVFKRFIRIGSDNIEVLDLVDGGYQLERLRTQLDLHFSPGYGLRERPHLS